MKTEPRWAPKLSYDLSTSMVVTHHVTLIWKFVNQNSAAMYEFLLFQFAKKISQILFFPKNLNSFFQVNEIWLRLPYLLFHLSPVDGNTTKIIFSCSHKWLWDPLWVNANATKCYSKMTMASPLVHTTNLLKKERQTLNPSKEDKSRALHQRGW